MRIATVDVAEVPTWSVVVPGRGHAPATELDGWSEDLLDVLAMGLTTEVREKLEADAAAVPDDRLLPLDTPRRSPYTRPRKIWGIGLNYLDHATDLSEDRPEEPASFIKGDHTIVGPGEPIRLPEQSRRVTCEAELGLVIGRECHRVDEGDALDHVAAVCCVLDQTAEDILQRNPRFLTRAKNFPTFFSFGPELVTLDEVLDPGAGLTSLADITVETVINGRLHRANTVSNMAFSPEFLVSFHSHVMPLFPGDIISTGTPGAVAVSSGDIATARVQAVGELTNPVA